MKKIATYILCLLGTLYISACTDGEDDYTMLIAGLWENPVAQTDIKTNSTEADALLKTYFEKEEEGYAYYFDKKGTYMIYVPRVFIAITGIYTINNNNMAMSNHAYIYKIDVTKDKLIMQSDLTEYPKDELIRIFKKAGVENPENIVVSKGTVKQILTYSNLNAKR